jgi:hypothetical protein
MDGRKSRRARTYGDVRRRTSDGGDRLLRSAARLLALALGRDWKGKLSPVVYVAAIPLAFVSSWIASGLYAFVALLWLIPDRRIERALVRREPEGG